MKKVISLLLIGLVASLAVVVVSPAGAKKGHPKGTAAAKRHAAAGVVQSVGSDSVTLTRKKGNPVTVQVNGDTKIVVKINAVEKLRAELADRRWRGEPVAMGTNTDPYQRAEAKYRLTRGVLEALTERSNPFSILTKSPLVTRDLDVIVEAAQRANVSVNFSIGTLDQRV